MHSWFTIFLFSFTAGMLLYPLLLVNKKLITNNFQKIPVYVGLFLGMIYLMVSPKNLEDISLFSVILSISLLWNFRTIRFILYIICLGLYAVSIHRMIPDPVEITKVTLSAMLSGAALGTMLLGHSYLSDKLMSFEVLINNIKAFVFLLLFNTGASCFLIMLNLQTIRDFYQNSDLILVFACMRLLTGIIIAPILAMMALKCAKLHSNQSATGILYSVCTLVIVSEMANHYLLSRGLLV